MDFKRIITSMSIIGLISCPAFAGQQVKHRHHHRSHHKAVAAYDYKNDHNYKADTDYKDTASVVAPCAMNQSTLILNDMNQNRGRAMPNPCDTDWFKHIRWNGGVTVDWLKLGNRSSSFMGVNYQRFSLNDAYLNIGVDVNRWAQAFASISYDTTTINAPVTMTGLLGVNEYSAAYSNNVGGGALHALQLEQAYATLGNLDEAPVFVQVGKQFQDFSRYTIHPITRSLVQSLSEVLATSVRLGFVSPSGLNGSVAVFDDPLQKIGSATSKNTTTNYNVALGYDQSNDQLGFNVGAAWIYNIIAANDVAYHVQQNNVLASSGNGYNTKVSGVALYGNVNSGPFSVSAHYTSTFKRFNFFDLPRYPLSLIMITNAQGAKPWAADLQLGYAFDGNIGMMNGVQSVYVGYQASRDTSFLGLPKSRWVLGYNVAPCKNTAFALEWDRDRDHSTRRGGTGKSYNLLTLRSTVKFG